MDDSSSHSSDNHPQNRIQKLISKIQNISKFQAKDLGLFIKLRDAFSMLSSDLLMETSKVCTPIIIDTSIKIIKKTDITSRDNSFLENLINLLILMGFHAAFVENIERTIRYFSKISKTSNTKIFSLILHLFHIIIVDEDQKYDEIRQTFLKYFIPVISAHVSSFLESNSRPSIPFISVFAQSTAFLMKLSFNTYNSIQDSVQNLLNNFVKLLEIKPSNEADIQNVADLAHIQSKIIHIFLVYQKQSIPVPKIQSYIPYLIPLLHRIHPCYFTVIKQILFDIRLVLDLHPKNQADFDHLLSNFTLFCQFKRYNQHLLDAYTVFIQHVYQSSTTMQLFTEKHENDLIFFIINVLHYKAVPRFIRHNEFSFIQNHVHFKPKYFKLYLFTFDIDIKKLINSLKKIELQNDLASIYNKINNVEYCILKILEQLSKYCSSNRFTREYSVNELNGLDFKLFELAISHLLELISLLFTIFKDIEKRSLSISSSIEIEEFYEMQKSAIKIDTVYDECQKRLDQIMSQTQIIFSNIPFAFASCIWQIYFTNDFPIKVKNYLGKAFILKLETSIPLIYSQCNYFLNQFPFSDSAFNEMVNFFTLINSVEIDYKFSSKDQEIFKSYSLELISILKENYVNSTKYFNRSLELISLISRFANDFICISDFSSSLFNLNFLKDICQMSQFSSIDFIHILQFIKFTSAYNKEILLLPIVINVLINSIEIETENSIEILNQSYKINKNAILKHPKAEELFKKSAYLLNKIEKPENRKILLKFLKHGVNSNSDYQNVPLDLINLKTIEIYKNEMLFSIKFNQFLSSLKQSLEKTPTNEFLLHILTETIISIFKTENMSYEIRKNILNLFSLLLSNYKIAPKLVEKSLLNILNQFDSIFVVSSHAFASIFIEFDDPPSELICLVTQFISTENYFKDLVDELKMIVHFNLLNIQYKIQSIVQTLINTVPVSFINFVSISLFFVSHLLRKFDTHKYRHYPKLTFSELGYLSSEEISLILYIREHLSEKTVLIDEILETIQLVDPFAQLVLFELISQRECDSQIISFFEKSINDVQIISFLIKSFPDLINLKYDQIQEILISLKERIKSCSINPFPKKQDGDFLLLLNSVFSANNSITQKLSIDQIFSVVIPKLFTSSDLLYRCQARIGIIHFGSLSIKQIDDAIRSFFIDTLSRETFFNLSYSINFFTCYESLLTFCQLFPKEIFERILNYFNQLKEVDSIKSLESLFRFLSDEIVIQTCQKANYFTQLLSAISKIYVKFPFYRKNLFDIYLLEMITKSEEAFSRFLFDNIKDSTCLVFFLLLLENQKILTIFLKDTEKLRNIQIENIKQAALCTFFVENTSDIFDFFMNHIKSFKIDINSIEPFSCYIIINYLATKSPNMYLRCVLQILRLDSPLLLSLSRMIFKENIDKFEPETFLVITKEKHSNTITEPFFNYFIAYFIKKNPESLNFFQELSNSQTSYVVSSFLLELEKQKIDIKDFDILKIYKNCQNDKARLKTLQVLSRSVDSTNFDKTIKYLLTYISFYSPYEVFDCLMNLTVPNDKELPNCVYDNFIYFRCNDNLYSSLLAFIIRNKKPLNKQVQAELLIDLEFRLHYTKSQHIPNSIDLFESTFSMVESDHANSLLINRCKSYIRHVLTLIQKHPTSSSTFLMMILSNAFKITSIDNDQAFSDCVLRFFLFLVERTPKHSSSLSILTSFLPQLSELLIKENEIEVIERLVQKMLEIHSENQFPNIMIAINKFSKIIDIYQLIIDLNYTSPFLLPLLFSTFKDDLTSHHIDYTIEFLSNSSIKRSDLLLKQITIIYIINQIPQIILLPSFKDFLAHKNDQFVFTLYDLGFQINQPVYVDQLYQYLQATDFLIDFWSRPNIPHFEQILQNLNLNSLIQILHLTSNEFLNKVLLSYNDDPVIKKASVFSNIFNADLVDVVQFINNLNSSIALTQIKLCDDTPIISFQRSFSCIKNLAKWDEDFLKEQSDFALSFNLKAPRHILNSRFFLSQNDQILKIIEDKTIGLFELDQIICEDKLFDSMLSFMKLKINEPETVYSELNLQLNKLIKIIDDSSFINYLILHSLKFPLSMLIKKEFDFSNKLFFIQLSPSLFPKYHELYLKVQNSFLDAISIKKQSGDDFDFDLLSRKLTSINEQHKINCNNSIALYNGNETSVKSIEKDLERLITAVFLEPVESSVLESIVPSVEKLIKMNPVNDVALSIVTSHYSKFPDEQKFMKMLQLIKKVPYQWSQIFIEKIKQAYTLFCSMIYRIHKAFYLELKNLDTNIRNVINPIDSLIRDLLSNPDVDQLLKTNQKEREFIDKIRSEKEIDEEIDLKQTHHFLKSVPLPPIPPPLVDDQGLTISMKCYFKKPTQKYVNVDILLNNGQVLNYILSFFHSDHRLSLLVTTISQILQSDQRCSRRGQIIPSIISTQIQNDFTLSFSNDFEPLYHTFLFKKLKNKETIPPKSLVFSTKASYTKYFAYFGLRYSALCLIQSFLNKPTPSPIDIFINPKTSSAYFLKFDENAGDLPTSFRLCGKMARFLSKYSLQGPFLEGLVLSSTCFFMNQNKISLFLESILDISKDESFSFIERSSKLSIHFNDVTTVQDSANALIHESAVNTNMYIIPWL